MKNRLTILRLFYIGIGVFAFSIAWSAELGEQDNDSIVYPAELYLVGRGVGSTIEEASNRARGELATIFEVRIEVVTESKASIIQSAQAAQVSKQATQYVSIKTDKVISGINIVKTWRDPVTQNFSALAILSRAQAGASLREEINRIDIELKRQLQAVQEAYDIFLKIATLTQSLQTVIKRDGFQASLKVVDSSGLGLPATISQGAVQQQINDLLKDVRIAPRVVEDAGAKEFSALLKGGLAAAGFLTTSDDAAEWLLEGNLALMDLGRREGWNWMRATIGISLVEKESRRIRGRQTWLVKSSAQDLETVRARILIEVEKLLKRELRSAVMGFATH